MKPLLGETLIKSCHAIWRPFSRLAALSDGSISPASPAATRLARHENDSPSDVTAFNQQFLREATIAPLHRVWRLIFHPAALADGTIAVKVIPPAALRGEK
jgi:hypothetical protein